MKLEKEVFLFVVDLCFLRAESRRPWRNHAKPCPFSTICARNIIGHQTSDIEVLYQIISIPLLENERAGCSCQAS
jgi:hypothetical protein